VDFRIGDLIAVNLAPFIGWQAPCSQSVRCRIVGIDGPCLHVTAEPPHRNVSLTITAKWIDGPADDRSHDTLRQVRPRREPAATA